MIVRLKEDELAEVIAAEVGRRLRIVVDPSAVYVGVSDDDSTSYAEIDIVVPPRDDGAQ